MRREESRRGTLRARATGLFLANQPPRAALILRKYIPSRLPGEMLCVCLCGSRAAQIARIVKTQRYAVHNSECMRISWGRACAGALTGEVTQIAAAFGWVAIYSYLINPGQPFATYQAHAQVSGPWVSIIAGAPIFYAASRWIARTLPTALALFGIFLVIDGGLLVGMTESWNEVPFVLAGLSYLTKLGACALGGRRE